MSKSPHRVVGIGPPSETRRWRCACGERFNNNNEHKAHQKAVGHTPGRTESTKEEE